MADAALPFGLPRDQTMIEQVSAVPPKWPQFDADAARVSNRPEA
jgi:hypothetical protein